MKSMCADLGSDVGVRLELDATAAKGTLDRQGLAKVRHIDVSCLWLQEQCTTTMVLLVKIPGEINTANLMTNHLVCPLSHKYVKNLNLDIREGRSDQAAKLHSVSTTSTTQIVERTCKRNLPGEDYWAERGEHGRWVESMSARDRPCFTRRRPPEGQAERGDSRR